MGDVNDLHEHLKNLIDKSSIPWTYAILWECSSQRRVLRFKDGYHRGSGKAKQVRIMGSFVSFAEHASDYDAATQWFFKISMGKSFEINEDLPGYALIAPTWVLVNAENRDADTRYKWGMWERTKWAHQFGIRTFLCIPLQGKMVLELASTQIMSYYYNFEWIYDNSHLIYSIGTLTQRQQQPLPIVRFIQHQHQVQLLLLRQIKTADKLRNWDDADESNEEADEEAVNEMKNRGKEK